MYGNLLKAPSTLSWLTELEQATTVGLNGVFGSKLCVGFRNETPEEDEKTHQHVIIMKIKKIVHKF